MDYKKIQKGSVIGWDWFYVVVECVIVDKRLWVNCICDNANNVYSFSIDKILNTVEPHGWIVLSPEKAVEVASWDDLMSLEENDQAVLLKIGREIPLDIMAEVLSGKHDDRFEGYQK